jgi:hypothetical protein
MTAMVQRLKQYAIIAAAGFLLWGLMHNHFIFEGHHVHLLTKTELNLHDTFVSLHNKKPEMLIKNERLREAGIGDLLVEVGMLTEDEKSQLESKYRYGD